MIPYIKHKFFLSQTIEKELRILNKFAKGNKFVVLLFAGELKFCQ